MISERLRLEVYTVAMEEEQHAPEVNQNPEQQNENTEENSRTSRFKNKKVILIVAVVMLLCVAAVILIIAADDDQSASETSQDEADSASVELTQNSITPLGNVPFADLYVPDFSDMRGYAEVADEHWYAAFQNVIVTSNGQYRVYTRDNFDSITSFTDVVNRNGEVWIGGQGGVARYKPNSDSFDTFLIGESNVDLSVDPFDGKLYVGTFKGFFIWEDSNSSFVEVPGTDRGQSHDEVAFTDTHIIVKSTTDAYNNSPVRVYEKSSQKWASPDNLAYTAAGERSSDISIMNINNVPLVYGRDARYTSCETSSVYPASVFYSFRDGEFVSENQLNEVFKSNEAQAYSASAVSLLGSGSCNDEDDFVVDIVQQGDSFVAENRRVSDKNSGYSFYTFTDRIEQLAQELGFAPSIYPANMVGDKIYSLWNSRHDSTIPRQVVRTDGATTNTEAVLSNSDLGLAVSFVECGGSSFVLNSSSRLAGLGDPFLISIFKVDGDEPSEIFSATNTPIYEGVDAQFNVANAEGLCINDKVVILGTNALGILNPADNMFTQVGLNEYVRPTANTINANKDGFVFVNSNSNKLITIQDSLESKKSVDISLGGFNSNRSISFVAASSSRAAIGIIDFTEKNADMLVTVNLNNGNTVESTELDKQIGAASNLDETRFILQYGDAETKLVNYNTHIGETISTQEFDPNETFNPGISPDSAFVFDGTHVWFHADGWGLLGYKVN